MVRLLKKEKKLTVLCIINNGENSKNLELMFNQLLTTNWQPVLSETTVDTAYNSFLDIFQNVHNSCCPVVATKKNPNKKSEEPWLTKGLQNACKKKNTLYKSYLIKQDKESEKRYKTYKNKLTTILRKEKQDYYRELLCASKDNIKETWNIINDVLKRKSNLNLYLMNSKMMVFL